MKKISRKIFTLYMLIFLTSCAYNQSFVQSTYKVLSVSKISYENSMEVTRDLQAKEIINKETVAKISVAATTFSTAHNSAVKLLAKYKETGETSDQTSLEAQINLASQSIITILEILKPYLTEASK